MRASVSTRTSRVAKTTGLGEELKQVEEETRFDRLADGIASRRAFSPTALLQVQDDLWRKRAAVLSSMGVKPVPHLGLFGLAGYGHRQHAQLPIIGALTATTM